MSINTPTFKRDPSFGHDPWIGPGVRPVDEFESHDEALVAIFGAPIPIYHGQDTIKDDVSRLDGGLDAYFSYVDNYTGWDQLLARFGIAHAWRGDPWGYTSASNMAELISAAGNRRFVKWSAHYGHGPHVCAPQVCGWPQADWTQWNDVGPEGQNVDQSIGLVAQGNGRPALVSITIFGNPAHCADMEPGAMQIAEFPRWYDYVAFHSPAPKPQPPTPREIMAIASAKNAAGDLNVVVAAQDNSLWYTFQAKGQYGWNGGVGGQHVAGLVPFAPAPPKPIKDMTMDTNAEGDLQLLVELSDGSLFYTFQQHGQHAWSGGVDGKHIAGLSGLAPAPGKANF